MTMFLLCLFTTLLALPKEVIFMRHGNKDSVPGPTDGRNNNWQKTLTPDGFEDAVSIQKFLQKYKREHSDDDIVLYASPFRRAIMTVACFAAAESNDQNNVNPIKIKVDRSLGEESFTFDKKESDHGVWDPKVHANEKKDTHKGCFNAGNRCSFANTECNGIFDVKGTRGPNCDKPIRDVVEHCTGSLPTDAKGNEIALDIIDPNYSQIITRTFHAAADMMGLKEARDYCKRRGEFLAVPRDQSETDAIKALLPSGDVLAWLGLTQDSDMTWLYDSSGLPVEWTNWNDGEGYGQNGGAVMWWQNGENGRWYDTNKRGLYYVVCDTTDYTPNKWYGKRKGWKDDWRLRAKYVYDNIINHRANHGKRVIIASHGSFMVDFFGKYVANGRTGKFNTGTMAFLQPNDNVPSGTSKFLKAVGERFSFASTNDMLWTSNTASNECVRSDPTPPNAFGYKRSSWELGFMTGWKTPESVPMVVRKGDQVSGFVLELKRSGACQGARLEYMDCEERLSYEGRQPVCLLAGWHATGGFECFGRKMLMFNSDKSSAKAKQDYREWWSPLSRYSAEKYGFWIKVAGLHQLTGGCTILETEALEIGTQVSEESQPEVREFSFESDELHQISLNGEWPEESRVFQADESHNGDSRACMEHSAMCGTFACVAVKNDGTAEAWGHYRDPEASNVDQTSVATNVANAMCGGLACVAVKNDGTAQTWGHYYAGGGSSSVDLTNVANAMCGEHACVAVKNDGTAEAWGDSDCGGDASSVDLTNVKTATCGSYACVAVKNDGTAEAWGDSDDGGDASGVDLTNVKTAMCGAYACVAVKNDGTAVTWGDSDKGGDASGVDLTSVANAMCGQFACVAMKNDGTAVTWGYSQYGGDSSTVDLSNVAIAMCGGYACVAVKNDGTAVAWGADLWGGDSSTVELTNVANAMCGGAACVAVKNDGTAVAWGDSEQGGDASNVDLRNVANAMCGHDSCVAVKNDGTAEAWGPSWNGGDTSSVDLTNVKTNLCAKGRRELNSFADIPFGFEAKSEFKLAGDMSMDFEFSPNPNILLKIVPPSMDIKAEMQLTLQQDIEHDITVNRYELTEKKTLYSDFFLVGAIPITVKVLAQPVADIDIKGTYDADGLVRMNLDGQVRISDEFIQLRLDLLEGELDYNTIEPSLQLTGFNDIWSFDFHAMASLDIDIKVGIQLEVVVSDAISFEFTPSVQASTTLSSSTGEVSSCPSLVISASAHLGTSMDIGAGLKRQDGIDFNLITLMEDNCKTFEGELTGGWFDWIDDWHFGINDMNSGRYYYDEEGYSKICSAVFDILDMSIAWDGSIDALKGLHFDQNLYNAELFGFDSPQVCMVGPEPFEVNSRGHFSQGIPMSTLSPTTGPTTSPTSRPTTSPTTRPTPSPNTRPTTSPTTGPTPSPTTRPTTSPTTGPTSSPRPTPSPTPSPTPRPTRPRTTARPTRRPTPSPTDDQFFCLTSSNCARDEFCDPFLFSTCQKKRSRGWLCNPGLGYCEDHLTCSMWLVCADNWWG